MALAPDLALKSVLVLALESALALESVLAPGLVLALGLAPVPELAPGLKMDRYRRQRPAPVRPVSLLSLSAFLSFDVFSFLLKNYLLLI